MECLGYGSETDGGTVSAPRDDVGEFAALLTRLKERTDRSYGSLARRLNMNTSTLHRYCAGEAVPQDFAPVERFAALCGASAEERLELHRLWLLAVAARQRPRTAETTAVGPAPAEAAPADGDSSRPAQEQADSSYGADGADGADSEPMPPPGGAPAPPPRPWYRRRRLLVSAAVAAVLVVTLGSLSALPSGSSGRDDSARPPAGPSGTNTQGGASRHPSAKSPSPSGTTGSPAAESAAGTGTGTGGTAKPSGKPLESRSPSGGHEQDGSGTPAVPLTWTVNSHVWNAGCGHDYVIDKPPAQVPPPPAAQDAAPWAATQGALHGRDTNVQISVQGRSSTAVVLEALRVRVVTRAAPARGNSYSMNQGCGGALTPRYFSVNLDADRPVAHSESGFDGENTIPAVRMPYRVSAEDPEVLLVTAQTETCDCGWYLELDWSSQGRTGTVRIDDDGRPFRTSGINGLPRYSYDTSGRRWASES
ncbi:DNA-binding protein [Streptomyces sp. MMG1533]|uniref:helix-turn-helix domain-containing protein n=1 Tax=Streptomyces sp. MMG1533 TaxID=1415546 RepID=UPI0006BFACBB|nr:helix-turn-helix transcriptional regulator [Streptomyces sp. MMG1533]KOU73451.1 DNA-binding protein [Streptomyces sp. MMG1533]